MTAGALLAHGLLRSRIGGAYIIIGVGDKPLCGGRTSSMAVAYLGTNKERVTLSFLES